MKIFFRYLFVRMTQLFLVCLAACVVIWIMVDLYGNMDDFLEHKAGLAKILYFYVLVIPKMLVQVLPATILISTLFTLINLNRRSELVALQAGGMAPIWIFSPFFLFTAIWVALLAYDMNGPSATAEVARERLLLQVKGQKAGREVFNLLQYVDNVNQRTWYFQALDTGRNKGTGVTILQRNVDGHDLEQYIANEASWNGEFWRLSGGVVKFSYGVNGQTLPEKRYEEIDLPNVTTTPKQLSLIISQPEQLTVSQLSQYIESSTQGPEAVAAYRTQWWDRVLFPFSLFIMTLYALLNGMSTERRGNVGVASVTVIVVFFLFMIILGTFEAAGKNYRLSPFLAVFIPELIFGLIGLHLLARANGWWWQLAEFWKHWNDQDRADHGEDALR
jgi:lipopolysaccharide export system permease protein